MVSYTEIQAANSLINDANGPKVAVFIGGTSGIGKATVRALVATGTPVRIYLVGRPSSEERTRVLIAELAAVNPRAEVVWTPAEASLLAETKRVCETVVAAREARVDLLFLSAGYAPFGARHETAEGLEVVQALEYYSRVLAVMLLLPLLRAAEAGRVVSVLGGGMEWGPRSIDLDDLDMRRPGSFGAVRSRIHNPTMNTTTLEKLAVDNPDVTFVHSCPGWVDTGNVRRGLDRDRPNAFMAWFVSLVLEPLIYLLSMSNEESGQRHLFQSTSAAFGGRGVPWTGKPGINSFGKQADGLFLASYKCDCSPNAKVVPLLREKAQPKIWDHTLEVLRPYL